MESNIYVLKDMLDKYFLGEISKAELSSWSQRAYYELMCGDFVFINKLVIYHFLRTISSFNIIPNDIKDEYPCTENEVQNIKSILNGIKTYSYTFNIKIQKKIYDTNNNAYLNKLQFEEYSILREYLFEFYDKGKISTEKINTLILFSKKGSKDIVTIIDLLESHIKGILSDNIDYSDNFFDFHESVGIGTGSQDTNNKNIFPNLLKIFDCILGNTCFRISIIYENGLPNISLLM